MNKKINKFLLKDLLFLLALGFFTFIFPNISYAACGSWESTGTCQPGVDGSTCQQTQKCDCAYNSFINSITNPPQQCDQWSYTTRTRSFVVNGGTQVMTSDTTSACVQEAPECHPTYLTGCTNNSQCPASDACTTYACNLPYAGAPSGQCNSTNLCGSPVLGYCGDLACNNGETNATCPGDCPTAGFCASQPTYFLNNSAASYSVAQGGNTSITYQVGTGGGASYGHTQTFECPAGNACGSGYTTTNPQTFNNDADFSWYNYPIRPLILGWQTIMETGTGVSSSASCSNPSYSNSVLVRAYRGEAYNVNVSSAAYCGANTITWDSYNLDDRFNVIRAPVSSPGNLTTIASNILGWQFIDNTATVGTKYFYYVQIANRDTGSGEPVGSLTWANQNFGPTNGVAPTACPINGTCGTANGQTLGSAPSGGALCNSGTASAVSGSGPWTWNCNSNSTPLGTNASCSANRTASPTVTLSASPTSIASGGSSTISWTVANATSCVNSGANNIPNANWTSGTTGSVSSGALSSNQTYRLTCTGPGGSVQSNSVTVTVTANPAPTVSLSASPTSIASGGSSTISWTVANATSCVNSGANNIPNANWTSGTTGSVSSGALSSSQTYRLTCTGPGGTTQSSSVTVTVTVSPYASCTGSGTIKRDYWTGINGNLLTNLTGNVNYPNSPSGTANDSSFEAPTNWGDNYGQRMYGTVVAPATGNYTFYIATDDDSELWLGTTSSAASKVRIAYLSGWAGSRSWYVNGTQASVPISLTAGQTYYIEAIHKEGGGGDNLAVGWVIPGSSVVDVIPGVCLSPPAVSAPTVTLSASPTSVSLGGSSTISWTVANATSCVNSGANNIPNANWTSGTTGSVSSGALSSSQTYRLTCTGPGGTTQSSNVTVSILAPTVSLSASPTSIASGGSSTISWTVANATSCVNSGANNIPNANWTSGTTGSVSSGALSSSQTYRLTCTGPGGTTQSSSVTVNITPTATLSASPNSVNSGSASTLSWTITNATSCTSIGTDTMPAGAWSTGTTGTVSTGALTSDKTYRISCTGPGGSVQSANVTVSVTPAPPGGGGGGGACNAAGCNPNPPGGGSLPVCLTGVVRLYWTDNSSNETSFKVYRDGSLVATVATPNQAGTGYVVSYDYVPGDNTLHTYTVSAINGALESSQSTIVPAPGIAATICLPNLGGSDKDITKVNSITIGSPTPCNGNTQALPSNITLQNGNKLTFQINVCNSGMAPATNIIITDRMINLAMPTSGWNIKYNGSSLGAVGGSFSASGTSPNQTLTINLGTASVAIGSTGVVTFDAILTKPVGFNGNSARFQNTFSISSTGASGSGSTPLLPFYTGNGNPEIIEVP